MNIVLIGYRGTGKSTVGKRLAEKCHLAFYDTDDLVERHCGQSIGSMIDEKGWDFFRKREKEAVRGLLQAQGAVIATGGGVVLDRENVDRLKQRGFLIWLDADVQTIIRRIQADSAGKQQRPPLSGHDLNEETVTLLQERIPFYRRAADVSVDTTDRPVGEIVDEIYRRVKEVLPCQEAP